MRSRSDWPLETRFLLFLSYLFKFLVSAFASYMMISNDINYRFGFVALFCLVLSLTLGNRFARAADPIPDVAGWQLEWHDEFEGTTLDNAKWAAMNRRNSFNNEKQYYRPEQVVVADGSLQLTAINVPFDGKAYQSGLVTSQDLFGPGRFEARIDLPTSQGMWPAFWLNANQVSWPEGGEIDIMENRGSSPNRVSSAYHWQTDPGPCCDQHEYVTRPYQQDDGNGGLVDFHADYHIYAAEWDDTTLKFYVDGNLYHTVTETENRPIFETQKNIILNLAVGGDFGGDPDGTTIWPQTMYIDYVRYWKPQVGLQGDYNNDGSVDAADYSVWRDAMGQTGIDMPADGSGNGTIDAADYEIWRDNFGGSLPAAANEPGNSVSVPEPSAGAMLLYSTVVLACRQRLSK